MVQQNDHGFWTSFYLRNKKTWFFLGLGGGSFYNTIWIFGEDGFFVFFPLWDENVWTNIFPSQLFPSYQSTPPPKYDPKNSFNSIPM